MLDLTIRHVVLEGRCLRTFRRPLRRLRTAANLKRSPGASTQLGVDACRWERPSSSGEELKFDTRALLDLLFHQAFCQVL